MTRTVEPIPIVLCGGRGSRMAPLSDGVQKCTLRYNGVPILTTILDRIRTELGLNHVVIATGYAPSSVMSIVDEYSRFSRMQVVHHPGQLEPRYRLLLAREIADGSPFLYHAGDVLCEPGHLSRLLSRFSKLPSDYIGCISAAVDGLPAPTHPKIRVHNHQVVGVRHRGKEARRLDSDREHECSEELTDMSISIYRPRFWDYLVRSPKDLRFISEVTTRSEALLRPRGRNIPLRPAARPAAGRVKPKDTDMKCYHIATRALVAALTIALAACEEAAPPTTAPATPAPAASAPPAPRTPTPITEPITITITANTLTHQQVTGGTMTDRTIRFPEDFNTGRRHDVTEIIDHWYTFTSKPINNLLRNKDVLTIGGISLDNSKTWFLKSIEINPSLWINVQAVTEDTEDPDAYATIVINLHVDVPITPQDIHTTTAEAAAIIRTNLSTNSITIRF